METASFHDYAVLIDVITNDSDYTKNEFKFATLLSGIVTMTYGPSEGTGCLEKQYRIHNHCLDCCLLNISRNIVTYALVEWGCNSDFVCEIYTTEEIQKHITPEQYKVLVGYSDSAKSEIETSVIKVKALNEEMEELQMNNFYTRITLDIIRPDIADILLRELERYKNDADISFCALDDIQPKLEHLKRKRDNLLSQGVLQMLSGNGMVYE